MLRGRIAVVVPEAAHATLLNVQQSLKRAAAEDGFEVSVWPDVRHLNVVALDYIANPAMVRETMDQTGELFGQFEVTLEGVCALPSWKKPRDVSMIVRKGKKSLRHLHGQFVAELASPGPAAAYVPQLSLARCLDIKAPLGKTAFEDYCYFVHDKVVLVAEQMCLIDDRDNVVHVSKFH